MLRRWRAQPPRGDRRRGAASERRSDRGAPGRRRSFVPALAFAARLGECFASMLSPDFVREYLLAHLSGTLPPRPTATPIPADKDAHPKVLALDCNMWIALSRSHYERPDATREAKTALDAIRTAIALGRLVVVFTLANAVEAAAVKDSARRERLARFIVDLSNNHGLGAPSLVGLLEVRAAVAAYLGEGEPAPVRPRTIGVGLRALFGDASSAEARAVGALVAATMGSADVLAGLTESPRATVEFLVERMRADDAVQYDRRREARATQLIQASRETDARMPERERRRANLANMWDHASTEPVRDALREAGSDAGVFKAWLDEGDHLFDFWDAVPTMHVLSVLEGRASTNPQRRIAANDLRDVEFYQVAIPYANVLATEKHWASIIKHTKLDARFGTRIVKDLADLPDALRAEGCL